MLSIRDHILDWHARYTEHENELLRNHFGNGYSPRDHIPEPEKGPTSSGSVASPQH
jgi:hypothetical protein